MSESKESIFFLQVLFFFTYVGIVFNSHIQHDEPLECLRNSWGKLFSRKTALEDKARLQELLDSMQEMRMRPGP